MCCVPHGLLEIHDVGRPLPIHIDEITISRAITSSYAPGISEATRKTHHATYLIIHILSDKVDCTGNKNKIGVLIHPSDDLAFDCFRLIRHFRNETPHDGAVCLFD